MKINYNLWLRIESESVSRLKSSVFCKSITVNNKIYRNIKTNQETNTYCAIFWSHVQFCEWPFWKLVVTLLIFWPENDNHCFQVFVYYLFIIHHQRSCIGNQNLASSKLNSWKFLRIYNNFAESLLKLSVRQTRTQRNDKNHLKVSEKEKIENYH